MKFGESQLDEFRRPAPGQRLVVEDDEIASLCLQLRSLWNETHHQSDTQAPSFHASTDAMGLPIEFGPFVLLDEIGRGGMGVVYRAYDKRLFRHVALKRILTGELASAEDRSRFQREARLAGTLDHPGIVPVYEVGELEGHLY